MTARSGRRYHKLVLRRDVEHGGYKGPQASEVKITKADGTVSYQPAQPSRSKRRRRRRR